MVDLKKLRAMNLGTVADEIERLMQVEEELKALKASIQERSTTDAEVEE